MDRSLTFYRDDLGFDRASLWGTPPCFALVSRDNVTLMLALADEPQRIEPNWRLREKTSSAYIWVPDVRALYEEFLAREVCIDFSLYEAPHGCLEFGVRDPDGHDISFGQVIR